MYTGIVGRLLAALRVTGQLANVDIALGVAPNAMRGKDIAVLPDIEPSPSCQAFALSIQDV